MTEPYPDLTNEIGRVIAAPSTRSTSKGDMTRVPVAVTRQYKPRNPDGTYDNSGDEILSVVSFNEKQRKVLDRLYTGMIVGVQGNARKSEYQGRTETTLTAFRIWRCVDVEDEGI